MNDVLQFRSFGASLVRNPFYVDELEKENERLRDVIRKLHTLADTAARDWGVLRIGEALREMQRITTEEVKR